VRIARRSFLHAAALGLPAARLSGASREFSIRTLTGGPKHHFFGYYGICPWNRSGVSLVCLESSFQDHLPRPDEPAAIGLVDAKTGVFRKIAETRAWNFQQGAMLHWNPVNPEDEILYNEREGDGIISVRLNVRTGKRQIFPRGINGVSRQGRYALSLTYGRLTRLRPVVGYAGTTDPNPDVPHPDNDGVFLLDLVTGDSKLAVSIARVYGRLVKKHKELRDRHMWFNHTVFSKDDKRFFFLARCWTPEPHRELESAMFTCNFDGSDLVEAVPFGKGVSHFEWRNGAEIMSTFRLLPGTKEKQHVLFTDGKQDYKHIGAGFLHSDGHCSFAPDGDWFVTDENNAQTISKKLMVYNVRTNEGIVLGTFPMYEKRFLSSDLRCDLHPRWNRAGDAICFDALAKDGSRQLHIATLKS
jgi:hypothetical protein